VFGIFGDVEVMIMNITPSFHLQRNLTKSHSTTIEDDLIIRNASIMRMKRIDVLVMRSPEVTHDW
jgi:hypothetical protein